MTTTVGWILLATLSVSSGTSGDMVHSQYDWSGGKPPKIYATRGECHQQLLNLVYEDEYTPYEVFLLGVDMYAESFGSLPEKSHRKVVCFEILDTPD